MSNTATITFNGNTYSATLAGPDAAAATDITVDTTGFEVVTDTNLQTHLASNDTALLNARSTGVRTGGNLTDLGSGVVRIASGAGQILDNTDTAAPDYTAVTWTQTDLDLSAVDTVYYISVSSSGTVSSSTTEPDASAYRTTIPLWRVSIRSGAVSGTTSIVMPTQNITGQIDDIFEALGFIKSGLALSSNGANLQWQHASGRVYVRGINFYNSSLSPHTEAISATNPVTFRLVTADGTQTADRTTLDPANYNPSGSTVSAVTGASTRATIFTVKLFPGADNYRVFYGQTVYTNLANALGALQAGNYAPTFPAAFDNAVTLGWIIVQAGSTDLSDGSATFVTANKFGLLGGAISTSGASSLLTSGGVMTGGLGFDHLSADPANPPTGESVLWVSDGTGTGDAGDVLIKINVGGTVKTVTLVDYSAA